MLIAIQKWIVITLWIPLFKINWDTKRETELEFEFEC